ncbi:Ku protein [Carboxydochorda subterranea]|uniref:Non-homologous end joining protein Ku n=1 Tax=Carboxydichorda subterranea TaxID=3109565 RepID=A0ABZ1BUC3_9FIRM|nr:Ku protein [Limnochorda sp. L945t]WRP16085.1 Ku protein [Limnochorda sp. L945t]
MNEVGPFRSLWRATVSFALVSIPVKVYAATEDKDIHLRQLHDRCHSPIEYRKWCPVCDTEVQPEHVVSGWEVSPGRFVPLTEEELDALPLPEGHTVQIMDFVSLAEVDPVYFERPYYLEPAEGAVRAYRLLVEAMQSTGRMAVARMALRRRESLAALRPSGNVLTLETMRFHDEVRAPDQVVELPSGSQPTEREREMAVQLVRQLTTAFEPRRYQSRRREAFTELIERKLTGKAVVEAPAQQPPPVADLVEALKASLQQTDGSPDGTRKDGRRRVAGARSGR